MVAAGFRHFAQHGQERRQTRAARQHQHRPFGVAQVEAAQRPLESQLVARLGPVGQIAAHQPARHVADQECRDIGARRRAERVGTRILLARHLDLDVLAGQEVQPLGMLDLERQAFLSLCGEKKTLERIQSVLKAGKPIRN